VKRLAVIENEPFGIPYSRMNHLHHYWNKRMLTIVQNTFYNCHAQWLPLVDERFLVNKLVAISIILFFGLGVTNNTAKPHCVIPIGVDGFLNEGCSSSKLIVIKINETQLSWKQQSSQNMNTGNHTFDFLSNAYWVSLF
jgi:hypothetical protein